MRWGLLLVFIHFWKVGKLLGCAGEPLFSLYLTGFVQTPAFL